MPAVNLTGAAGVCLAVTMIRPVENAAGKAAFEALYRRELVTLIALGTTMTGDRTLGADLAYEAMVRAYGNWVKVGAMDRPGAWVRRVLINLAIDACRKRSREADVVARLGPLPAAEPVDPSGAHFWAAVRALPERQRAAVVLRYIEDMTLLDIADVLGVTEGTIKTSLFKARRTLAKALGTEEVIDDHD